MLDSHVDLAIYSLPRRAGVRDCIAVVDVSLYARGLRVTHVVNVTAHTCDLVMQILTQVALEQTGNVRSIAWHHNSNLLAVHNVSKSTVNLLQPDRAQVCNTLYCACASRVAA